MYFKVFGARSWNKKTGQNKTGVFRGALILLNKLDARNTVHCLGIAFVGGRWVTAFLT